MFSRIFAAREAEKEWKLARNKIKKSFWVYFCL